MRARFILELAQGYQIYGIKETFSGSGYVQISDGDLRKECRTNIERMMSNDTVRDWEKWNKIEDGKKLYRDSSFPATNYALFWENHPAPGSEN